MHAKCETFEIAVTPIINRVFNPNPKSPYFNPRRTRQTALKNMSFLTMEMFLEDIQKATHALSVMYEGQTFYFTFKSRSRTSLRTHKEKKQKRIKKFIARHLQEVPA